MVLQDTYSISRYMLAFSLQMLWQLAKFFDSKDTTHDMDVKYALIKASRHVGVKISITILTAAMTT